MSRTSHESFLAYEGYRHLKWAIALCLASIAAYVFYAPDGVQRGDTVVGWTLGILSGVLLVWLLWFGVRKRNYGAHRAPLRGWLSAHVYLGLALPLLAALHFGFQLRWNVHGLLYLLVVLVILTGILGTVLYRQVPAGLSRDRASEKLEGLLEQISDLDADCRNLVGDLPDTFARAVATSIDQTYIGGGLRAQLRATPPQDGTLQALQTVEQHLGETSGRQREAVGELLTFLGRKQALLTQVRKMIRSQALLQVWLIAHAPLAVAALGALIAHVVVVLYM